MPGTDLHFRLTGSDKVEENIRKYIGRMKDIRPVGDALISHFRQIMEKQFESSGAYLGDAWPELKDSTLAAKARRGTAGNGILRDRMNLYYSLTGGGPGSVEIVTEDSVTFGSDVYYLGYLDKGTRNMVARPVYGDKVMFLRDLEREFSRLISDHIAGRPIAASGELGGGSSDRSEGFLSHVLHEVSETVKRGREKGDQWAENWSNAAGGGGRRGGGGPAVGGM